MIGTILRYIPSVIVSVTAVLLAFILAPFACLPCFITTDKDGREHISPFWQWITTHDALIDIYRYAPGGREHWFLGRYSEAELAGRAWLRYCARVFWIWRNPAYQVGHWLGYDQRGVRYIKYAESEATWDMGVPSFGHWTAINGNGYKAFLWEKQIYWHGQWCLEMQFGWKLYREDPDQVCMLAFRFHPFKHYPKVAAATL